MTTSIKAFINPKVLIWAREEAYMSINQVSQKLGVSVDKVNSWEKGSDLPTIIQLRKLAKIYQQPFAVFYLSEIPPTRRKVLRDFRRLPSTSSTNVSPSLVFAIREAADRREVFLELAEETQIPTFDFNFNISINSDIKGLGSETRDWLGVTPKEQFSWRDNRFAFNAWREKLETKGVLIFQISEIDLNEVRGFSIAETQAPVIVLNRKDAINGRIFTLFHEFCHILLRSSGICDLQTDLSIPPEEQTIEVFCNQLASEILVPPDMFLAEDILNIWGRPLSITRDDIEFLAKRYCVSREVIARRLLTFGIVNDEFYKNQREEYLQEYSKISKRPGFVPPASDVISKSGKKFVSQVIDSFYNGVITSTDVSDYLGVRWKHVGRIEERLRGM